jgi:hypothetical protein
MTTDQALKILVQAAGTQRRLAEVLETTDERVSRWMRGHHAVPPILVVLAEFIDQTAPRDWPARWRR